MKKVFIGILILLIFAIGAFSWYYFLSPRGNLKSIYAIPSDAMYILESDEPIETWQTISSHQAWTHLLGNQTIRAITSDIQVLDSIYQNNKTIFKQIGKRNLLISAHPTKNKEYDFLYVIDLKESSKLLLFKNYLAKALGNEKNLTTRTYHEHQIFELVDPVNKTQLNISNIENLLVLSFTHTLVEKSIDQYKEPMIGRDLRFIDISNKIDKDGLFQSYIQWSNMEKLLDIYLSEDNEYKTTLSQSLDYTALEVKSKGNDIQMNGFVGSRKTNGYMNVLLESGSSQLEIDESLPERSSIFVKLGFDDFASYYESLIQKFEKDSIEGKEILENLERLEKFLDIDIKNALDEWIDDEVAFVQLESGNLGKKNEMAIVVKAKSQKKAEYGLELLHDKIRKKTPVKFTSFTYKSREVKFLMVKGLFKLLFGKLFEGIEKPYYTILDQYIVFSNHPLTLKNFINDYDLGRTLDQADSYKKFSDRITSKSALTMYVNTPVFLETVNGILDKETFREMKSNRKFLVCFPQWSITIQPERDGFDVELRTSFLDPKIVDRKREFKKNPEKEKLYAVGPQSKDPFKAILKQEKEILEEDELIDPDDIGVDDLEQKTYQEFYDDGKIKIEVPLKEGLKHGTYRAYAENGQIIQKGKYKMDQRIGVWKTWDENGKRLSRIRY